MKRAASTPATNISASRRSRLRSLLLGIALPLSCVANADAATNIFLKWSDSSIVGDSNNAQHPGEVVLTSYSQSDSNPVNLTSVGGRGSGRPTCGHITVMKQIDRSSPEFLGKVFEGSRTNPSTPVTITFEKSAGGEVPAVQFYKVQLFEVAVTSVTQNDTQADTVSETIVLEAARFRFTFTPQNADGGAGTPVIFGWDCLANRAF